MSYAFYQAPKIGLHEIYRKRGVVTFLHPHEESDGAYLGYHCDARDAFGMAEGDSVFILRQVLGELRCQTHQQDAMSELQ